MSVIFYNCPGCHENCVLRLRCQFKPSTPTLPILLQSPMLAALGWQLQILGIPQQKHT